VHDIFEVVGGGSNKVDAAIHKITSSMAILGVKESEGYDE
jgi:hypothetical protein